MVKNIFFPLHLRKINFTCIVDILIDFSLNTRYVKLYTIYVYRSVLLQADKAPVRCWSRQLVANTHCKIVKILVQIVLFISYLYLAYDTFI